MKPICSLADFIQVGISPICWSSCQSYDALWTCLNGVRRSTKIIHSSWVFSGGIIGSSSIYQTSLGHRFVHMVFVKKKKYQLFIKISSVSCGSPKVLSCIVFQGWCLTSWYLQYSKSFRGNVLDSLVRITVIVYILNNSIKCFFQHRW